MADFTPVAPTPPTQFSTAGTLNVQAPGRGGRIAPWLRSRVRAALEQRDAAQATSRALSDVLRQRMQEIAMATREVREIGAEVQDARTPPRQLLDDFEDIKQRLSDAQAAHRRVDDQHRAAALVRDLARAQVQGLASVVPGIAEIIAEFEGRDVRAKQRFPGEAPGLPDVAHIVYPGGLTRG